MASARPSPGAEERVAAAAALVAADEHLGAGLEVQLPDPGARRARSAARCGISSAWRAPAPTTRATRGVSEPGARTSSTTFGMSSVGRLSMTNQPRSSRSSAACERPAPDKPGDDHELAHAVACFSQWRKQEARDGGRRFVLCRTGQEPGWRGRLVHAARATSPASARAFTYRDSGRWMKGMNTPFSTSSIVSSSTR